MITLVYQDDLVVCLLRGGFTRVEETLREAGRGPDMLCEVFVLAPTDLLDDTALLAGEE